MRVPNTLRLLIAATALATVAACAAAHAQARDDGGRFAHHRPGMHQGFGGHHGAGPMAFLRGLDLTDAQKTQIHDIMKANRPEKPSKETMAQRFQAMKDLRATLLAPTVDAAKLESQLQAMQANRADLRDRFTKVAAQIRDVLTPEQRQKLDDRKAAMAEKFKTARAGKAPMRGLDRLLTGVTLTDAQKQAADTLKAAMATRPATPPVHEIAQFAASLDQSQRAQIAKTMRKGFRGGRHDRRQPDCDQDRQKAG